MSRSRRAKFAHRPSWLYSLLRERRGEGLSGNTCPVYSKDRKGSLNSSAELVPKLVEVCLRIEVFVHQKLQDEERPWADDIKLGRPLGFQCLPWAARGLHRHSDYLVTDQQFGFSLNDRVAIAAVSD